MVGIRKMGAFNLSLLGKWCWRMLVDKEGLWYKVLKARYGEVGGGYRRVGDRGRRGGGCCVIFVVELVREWIIGLKRTLVEL